MIHFEVSVRGRSSGRTAVGAAAYRSGTRMVDDRHGYVHDFRGKDDVVHREIIIPADAPEWMLDRARLWAAVDRSEKRRDARFAREIIATLPRGIGLRDAKMLVAGFICGQCVQRGMVADWAIHETVASDGQPEAHAHILLTLRKIDATSPTGFGNKERAWDDTGLLLAWRRAWAAHLAAAIAHV